jgi:hypothetical protein
VTTVSIVAAAGVVAALEAFRVHWHARRLARRARQLAADNRRLAHDLRARAERLKAALALVETGELRTAADTLGFLAAFEANEGPAEP